MNILNGRHRREEGSWESRGELLGALSVCRCEKIPHWEESRPHWHSKLVFRSFASVRHIRINSPEYGIRINLTLPLAKLFTNP